MRLSLKHSTFLASVLFFPACSSVPDGAPQEFHVAQAAIDEIDDADIDDILPTTVERAETTMKEALDLYDKSEDDDLDRAARDQILREAGAKAVQAKTLAEEAKALDSQVKAWDNKIEDHQSYQKMTAELESLRQQLVTAQSNAAQATAQTEATSGQTTASAVKGPVAFFGLGETQVKGRFTESLASLASVLKADPKAQVKLVGYTDSKGNPEKNRELAKARAESVSNILESMGVAKNQIVIDGYGVDDSVRSKNAGDAQLARRVEASIVSGDGTEMSSR